MYLRCELIFSQSSNLQERIEEGEDVEMQIDSDAEEETQARADGERGDRAKDNNQVSLIFLVSFCVEVIRSR